MRIEDVGSLPIVQGERLLGVVTDRDIVLRVVAEEKNPSDLPVAAVATRDMLTIRPDDRLDDALELMARRQIRRLLVVEDRHRLVGLLAQADVARRASPTETGEVVEAISEPARSVRLVGEAR
jgi:CBS domain-containing protein